MKSKSLVSIDQCSKEDILRILDNARKFEANPNRKVLEGKVAATLFFEPSTRTRLSFETAVNRFGGRVMVSFSVSPLEELVVEASEKPITRPPKRFTAVSKLSLVRVEGSKNRVAATLPSSNFRFGFSSNFLALSRIRRMSSLEH